MRSIVKAVILTVIILFLVWANNLFAQEVTASKDDLHILFLIDSSGTMKKNDPYDLRLQAAQLFAYLAANGDKISIIDFSTDPTVLTECKEITSIEDREEIAKKIKKIGNEGDQTDIILALKETFNILNRNVPDSEKGVVILLTDGYMALFKNTNEERYPNHSDDPQFIGYLEKVLKLSKANWKVYPIALTGKANTHFLRRIAIETAGGYYKADNAGELKSIYLSIFSDLYERFMTAPIHLTSENPKKIINVPLWMKEIKFLISKDSRKVEYDIREPDESGREGGPLLDFRAKNVYHSSFLDYEIIGISKPKSGEWTISLQGKGTIGVSTFPEFYFNIEPFPLKKVYRPGEKLRLFLSVAAKDTELRVKKPALDIDKLRETISAFVQIIPPAGKGYRVYLYNDGTHEDRYSNDDVFSNCLYSIPEFEGDHSAKFVVEYLHKNTFYKREVVRNFTVVNLPVLTPLSLPAALANPHTNLMFQVAYTTDTEVVQDHAFLSQARVSIFMKKPNGTELTYSMYDDGTHGDEAPDDGRYSFVFKTEESGIYNYEITAKIPYREEYFMDELRGTFDVGELILTNRRVSSPPKRKNIKLDLDIKSSFKEDLKGILLLTELKFIQREGQSPGVSVSKIKLKPDRITIKNGKNEIDVVMICPVVLKPGQYVVGIDFRSGTLNTKLENFELKVKSFWKYILPWVIAIAVMSSLYVVYRITRPKLWGELIMDKSPSDLGQKQKRLISLDELKKPKVLMGKDKCDIPLPGDASIEARHALLKVVKDRHKLPWIKIINICNGIIKVNERNLPYSEYDILEDGSRIQIGQQYQLTYRNIYLRGISYEP